MEEVIPYGFYEQNIGGTKWVVPVRYQNLSSVASGAFGCVCKAYDENRNREVAIKKLIRPFQDKEIAKRSYRELTLLHHFDHENVLDLLHVFTPNTSWQTLSDLYLVSTAMDCTLYDVLKSNRLNLNDIPFIIYQLLRGIKYIHGAGIIHRDLKPQNIGFNQGTNDLRILDFGLARTAETSMTGYVTTRWYRAPEVILNWMRYNQSADIWSVGCIMGEMLLKRPLFPGTCYLDQLSKITDLLGSPSEHFLTKLNCDSARSYVQNMPKRKKQDFSAVFTRASPDAIDMLESMLQIDPNDRTDAAKALAHSYLGMWNISEEETVAPPINILDSDCNVQYWKNIVWNEIFGIGGKNSEC